MNKLICLFVLTASLSFGADWKIITADALACGASAADGWTTARFAGLPGTSETNQSIANKDESPNIEAMILQKSAICGASILFYPIMKRLGYSLMGRVITYIGSAVQVGIFVPASVNNEHVRNQALAWQAQHSVGVTINFGK